MNQSFAFLIQTILAVLSQSQSPPFPEGANWQAVLSLSEYHNITNIIAYGVYGGSYDIPDDIKAKFVESLYEQIVVDENQKHGAKMVFDAFEENEIFYMPVKGCELKKIYPSTDMRCMSDIDVLIKTEQYGKISDIMKRMGYEFKTESEHEYIYVKPPFMVVELHKHLISERNADMYAYYKDIWSHGNRHGNSYRYQLDKNEHFVYLITHLAKHYRASGMGIRPIIDIYLYQKKYDDLDYIYINRQLEKLGIYEFACNVQKLIKVWFEGEETTEITEAMTSFICKSGEYGTRTNSVIVRTMRENMEQSFSDIEKKKYINVLFPDIEKMKQKHPILESAPFLLPFFWIWRIIKNFVLHWKLLPRAKCDVDSITAESMQKYLDHMKMVGLDVYNGRKRK